MKKVITIIILITLLLTGGLYFSQKQSSEQKIPNEKNKMTAYASFYPLYFFASEIGGDKMNVSNLTPAGTEPHEYDPSLQDLARIEESDFLILNGGIEAWGEKITKNLAGKDVTIITSGEGLFTLKANNDEHEEEQQKENVDPHIWLDPLLAKEQATKITKAFISKNPDNAAYYQENEKKMLARLDQLDAAYTKGLANCQEKEFITSHIAFAYLADRYGLTQVAIAGLSPEEEPSLQQLADVTKFAKEHNVRYIFFETLVSPKLSDTIAQEVGAQTLVLDPIEGISEDDIQQGKNYFTIMEENLKNLQTALQCE